MKDFTEKYPREIKTNEAPTQHMLDVWDLYHGGDLGECDFCGGIVDDLNNLNTFFNADLRYVIDHHMMSKRCAIYQDGKRFMNGDMAEYYDEDPIGVDNTLNKIFNSDHVVTNKKFIDSLTD